MITILTEFLLNKWEYRNAKLIADRQIVLLPVGLFDYLKFTVGVRSLHLLDRISPMCS